jgi:3' terminal RNA ribose 2'-O-methyltransferase Hen1
MILTISTTHQPATDIGYLLHKNPARAQSFELSFGRVHVVYSEIGEARTTAALLLDVDPVALVRGDGTQEQYVNDRPYAASSFLSVALARVLREAMAGRSKERQELAETAIPLEFHLTSVPARGGEAMLRQLFEPLGYVLKAERLELDQRFPSWGLSAYFNVTLKATLTLSSALTHLYVLIPVLDDDKHYWVGDDEVQKLLRFGNPWLEAHPARELITARYLKHRRDLTRFALVQLEPELEAEEIVPESATPEVDAVPEVMTLHQQRLETVHAGLRASGAKRVLDLGCGEGKLLSLLLKDRQFASITGMDVSHRALEIAARRLKIAELPERLRGRIQLLQGSLTYRDARLSGFDAAALVEVIEHLKPYRLTALERNVFEFMRPQTVIVTTPNAEYNIKWDSLPAGAMRHGDHRFEWSRAEFQAWAERVAVNFGYEVRLGGIGLADEIVGAPSQMAVFAIQRGLL